MSRARPGRSSPKYPFARAPDMKKAKKNTKQKSAPKKTPTLTHLGADGSARMVDVSGKASTSRIAVAEGRVIMSNKTLELVLSGNAKKGDVLGAARIAGIMAAKRTHELIPL